MDRHLLRVGQVLAIDRPWNTKDASQIGKTIECPGTLACVVQEERLKSVNESCGFLPLVVVLENPGFLEQPPRVNTVPRGNDDRRRQRRGDQTQRLINRAREVLGMRRRLD